MYATLGSQTFNQNSYSHDHVQVMRPQENRQLTFNIDTLLLSETDLDLF